jgi:hypothetical protein
MCNYPKILFDELPVRAVDIEEVPIEEVIRQLLRGSNDASPFRGASKAGHNVASPLLSTLCHATFPP